MNIGYAKDMYIAELLQDFIEHVEVERGRSQKTAENYALYMSRFIEFLGDIKVETLTTEHIRKWRLWLNRFKNDQQQGLSTLTQSYHLIALRSFLVYCSKRNIHTITPEKVELPKVARKQVSFLNIDEIKRLLDAVKTDDDAGLRDKAIIALLFSSGLRVSELVSLNRDHINLVRREFTVRGKGQKDRPVFVSLEAAEAVQDYLAVRGDSLPPLFIRYGGHEVIDTSGDFKRLTPRSIQRIVAHYTRMAGITKHVSPHTLRHSFATTLIGNGADIRSVQAMLGHSNISTTQIYTHVTDPHLREAFERFHEETT
jgi:site-specific recombinase XerD